MFLQQHHIIATSYIINYYEVYAGDLIPLVTPKIYPLPQILQVTRSAYGDSYYNNIHEYHKTLIVFS